MGIVRKIAKQLVVDKISYQPLIEVRVFQEALLHNLKQYQTHYPSIEIAPVLKSNGYGHGLIQVAKILDGQKLPFFVVDSFYEALILQAEGIKTKILILGFTTLEQVQQKTKNWSFGIISIDELRNISEHLKHPKTFHLKVDTGMHRQGILPGEINTAITLIKANKNIVLEGVCSHFADAETKNSDVTKMQISVWNDAARIFQKEFPHIKYFHVSNTAGIVYVNQIIANVGRVGIGLYGIDTATESVVDLLPALEMRSQISLIKEIGKNEKIGYDATFESHKPMKIAVVPAGYFEGVDRRLSNKGFFKVGNAFCPILGRVTMNMTTIDVTALDEVNLGQEVVIFSAQKSDKNSVENIAKVCGNIQREILVHIPLTLRRTIV